jgi:hypothetical protein
MKSHIEREMRKTSPKKRTKKTEKKCNVIEKKTFKGQSGRLQHNRRRERMRKGWTGDNRQKYTAS